MNEFPAPIEDEIPRRRLGFDTPAPWAAVGIVVVAGVAVAPGLLPAASASLAVTCLQAVVGALLLGGASFTVYRGLGAGCLLAALAQAAGPVLSATTPAAIAPATAAVLLALSLCWHLWLDPERWPWGTLTAAVLAGVAAVALVLTAARNAPWAGLLPGLLYLTALVELGRRRSLWRPGPAAWLVLSAAGGLAHAALWAAAGTPQPSAAASLAGAAVPLGFLWAALDRLQVQLAEATSEATTYRDANRALVLSSEMARRLQRRTESLRQVRDAVQAMETEAGIEAVLRAVRAALDRLRVPYNFCGLNVVDVDPETLTHEKTGDGGGPPEVTSYIIDVTDECAVSRGQGAEAVLRSWRMGEVVLRRDLQEEDPYTEREALEYLFGRAIRSVVDVPVWHGTLAVSSTAAAAFDVEMIADLKALAEVISDGFRRQDELREHRELEERLNSFFTHSLDLMCVAGFDGRLRMVNPAWTRTLGYAGDELVSRPLHHFIHEDDLRGSLVEVAKLRRGAPTITFENRFVRNDGGVRWLSWTAARDPAGTYIYGTAHDVTERVAAERQMQSARHAAEAARLAQSQFLANMNHELRTPLNAIIGYSELLMEEAADDGADEADLEDLGRIRGSARQLLSMISDVLDLSKIEAGRMDLRLERVSVPSLLEEAASGQTDALERNGNRLHLDVDEAPSDLHTDRAKVRQILTNLLSNAAKFTRDGQIALRARAASRGDRDGLEVSVQDTGVGMSPEQAEGIFDAFRQVDGSSQRKQSGTGLGLTISRRFCEMLGGEIRVESAPGSGSTFTLWLPLDLDRQP